MAGGVCAVWMRGVSWGVMGFVRNGWWVDWSARSEEIKVQRSGLRVATSHFFRGRGQLDDLIFRGLADDVFLGGEGWKKRVERKGEIIRHLYTKIVDHTHFSILSSCRFKNLVFFYDMDQKLWN